MVLVAAAGCGASNATQDGAAAGDASDGAGGGDGAPHADAGPCVPCHGTIIGPLGNQLADCTQVKDPAPGALQGAKIDLDVNMQPDGTCTFGGIALQCGGTGTFADGTPLMWSLAGGIVTLQDSTRVFTCKVQ
jgi:hypothetical protein